MLERKLCEMQALPATLWDSMVLEESSGRMKDECLNKTPMGGHKMAAAHLNSGAVCTLPYTA